MKTEARCLRDSSRWEEKGGCCEIYPVLYSKVEARDNGKGLLSLLPPPVFWFQPGGRTGATSRGNLCKHHTQGPPVHRKTFPPEASPTPTRPRTAQLPQRWSSVLRGGAAGEPEVRRDRAGTREEEALAPKAGRPDTQTGPCHAGRTTHCRGRVLRSRHRSTFKPRYKTSRKVEENIV